MHPIVMDICAGDQMVELNQMLCKIILIGEDYNIPQPKFPFSMCYIKKQLIYAETS